jgi:hypothetical protein
MGGPFEDIVRADLEALRERVRDAGGAPGRGAAARGDEHLE